ENKGALTAEQIFKRNLFWMEDSSLCLAQLDFPLPNNQELGIATMMEKDSEFKGLSYTFKHVCLPDPGTIWEMGFMFCLEKPVIGYILNSATALNLMLSKSLVGYVENPLDMFLGNGILWNLITEWKGADV
ncbi:unnamed protein product, partial [marine sediment metagenome]